MERPRTLVEQIVDAADRPGPDLAAPAFLVARARVPAPRSGAVPGSHRPDGGGRGPPHRARRGPRRAAPVRVEMLNKYLFNEVGFTGNREQYDDPRNSCLNEVLDRRTGIPITLALIYIEVARRVRRAGRGHQLPRPLPGARAAGPAHRRSGRGPDRRSVPRRRRSSARRTAAALLHRHMGEEAAWAPSLLARATRKQILIRMLLNLKRLYVRMRSFPQARQVTDILLALQPSSLDRAARSRPARVPHERRVPRAEGPRGST